MKKTRRGLALAQSRGHWLPPCLLYATGSDEQMFGAE